MSSSLPDRLKERRTLHVGFLILTGTLFTGSHKGSDFQRTIEGRKIHRACARGAGKWALGVFRKGVNTIQDQDVRGDIYQDSLREVLGRRIPIDQVPELYLPDSGDTLHDGLSSNPRLSDAITYMNDLSKWGRGRIGIWVYQIECDHELTIEAPVYEQALEIARKKVATSYGEAFAPDGFDRQAAVQQVQDSDSGPEDIHPFEGDSMPEEPGKIEATDPDIEPEPEDEPEDQATPFPRPLPEIHNPREG